MKKVVKENVNMESDDSKTADKKTARVRSIESFGLTNLKPGDSFYTDKSDKDITAIGTYYGVKVSTERLLVINQQTLTLDKIVRVTILEKSSSQ